MSFRFMNTHIYSRISFLTREQCGKGMRDFFLQSWTVYNIWVYYRLQSISQTKIPYLGNYFMTRRCKQRSFCPFTLDEFRLLQASATRYNTGLFDSAVTNVPFSFNFDFQSIRATERKGNFHASVST